MTTKKQTEYYYEHDEESFELPFDPEGDPDEIYISANGLKAVLAFLVRDEFPADPFEEFDEGDFYQFGRDYKHYTPRPDIEEFKSIVRANPGRVVTVDSCGDGYRAGHLVTPQMCRGDRRTGENSEAEKLLDDSDGYYIAPEDATNPEQYAKGSIEQYSAWCEGDVYGIAIWEYTRSSISKPWEDTDRGNECWGYYGYKYALETLREEFKSYFDLNSKEAKSE